MATDFLFDLWYGTETMRWVWSDELGANSEHAINAVGYRATKALPLRKLLKRLELPRDVTFVDLGSGKGRVLLLAAQLGFMKVVGVEFSPALCVIARDNVRKFTRQIKTKSHIEVVEADAALFHISPDHCIFYAYNPFDGVVLEKFLANLKASLNRFPRPVWFLYNTPLHARVIEASRLFSHTQSLEIDGVEFELFVHLKF